jgi:signal transduction histidine kinase
MSEPGPGLRAGAVAVGVAVAGLVGAGAALGLHVGNVHNGLIAVSFTAAGLVVLRSRPGNREGRLLTATGAAHAVMYAGRQYALHPAAPSGAAPPPGADWAGWIGVWPLPLVMVLAGYTLMCFPTGRLPSPGWRPVAVLMTALGAAMALVSALWPVEYARTGLPVGPPLQLPGAAGVTAVFDVVRPVGYLLLQGIWVACVIARLARSPREEARPLRGLVITAGAGALVMVAGVAIWGSPRAGLLAVPLTAVAATVGVLRLRRATPYEALSRLAGGPASPANLLDGVCAAVADGVGGRGVVLWVATGPAPAGTGGTGPAGTNGTALTAVSGWPAGRALAAGPRTPDEIAVGRWSVTPVVHDGQVLGVIALEVAPGEELSPAERRLLGELSAQAGLVLRLQTSAHRLVTAQDEARRRIERDLHDGVQQRLVTVAADLGRLARAATAAGQEPLRQQADAVRGDLLAATAELRELARGLHPAVLTQDGLEAALGQVADRSAVPVRLTVAVPGRLPAAVEATAYFLVSEALANAVKHAGAQLVRVDARVAPGGLAVSVADDGAGGAQVLPGGGLEGLADRLAALGARLELSSGPDGTRIGTVIPCG